MTRGSKIFFLRSAPIRAPHDHAQEPAVTLRRITRNRRLSPKEAAQYREVREQVAEELPDLIARHHERLAAFEQGGLLKPLKTTREEQG